MDAFPHSVSAFVGFGRARFGQDVRDSVDKFYAELGKWTTEDDSYRDPRFRRENLRFFDMFEFLSFEGIRDKFGHMSTQGWSDVQGNFLYAFDGNIFPEVSTCLNHSPKPVFGKSCVRCMNLFT